MQTSIERWREADGDNTYALDWELNEDSHVWEIGGYEGRWAQQIWDKFHCYITIFEPQLWAVGKMRERFLGIEKININPYGLWTDSQMRQMGNFHTDGASLVKNDNREPTMPCNFEKVDDEIFSYFFDIDLCLMNIEGGEYTLIPYIVHSGTIASFRYFWCQFHPENEIDQEYEEIKRLMDKTHEMIWDFYPTAVAWRKK